MRARAASRSGHQGGAGAVQQLAAAQDAVAVLQAGVVAAGLQVAAAEATDKRVAAKKIETIAAIEITAVAAPASMSAGDASKLAQAVQTRATFGSIAVLIKSREQAALVVQIPTADGFRIVNISLVQLAYVYDNYDVMKKLLGFQPSLKALAVNPTTGAPKTITIRQELAGKARMAGLAAKYRDV